MVSQLNFSPNWCIINSNVLFFYLNYTTLSFVFFPCCYELSPLHMRYSFIIILIFVMALLAVFSCLDTYRCCRVLIYKHTIAIVLFGYCCVEGCWIFVVAVLRLHNCWVFFLLYIFSYIYVFCCYWPKQVTKSKIFVLFNQYNLCFNNK